MKKLILLTAMCAVSLLAGAKDLKTLRLTTQPPMVCNNCENKIKKNIRFEKGIHEIATDLDGQVITVVYDADKTDEGKIVKAFDKIKYKAIILGDEQAVPESTCDGKGDNACQGNGGSCCNREGIRQ